jgi:hypothetical protein
MPIIDKRDRNNWYNCIHLAYQDEYNPLTDPYFNPETCPESEFRYRNGNVIAKIPKIEHRIFRKEDPVDGHDTILFVADEYYDKEKRQMRNVKVNIGKDISNFLPGWMLVNTDNYYTYFDKEGHLKYDPLQERREQKEKEKAEAAQRKAECVRKKKEKEQALKEENPEETTPKERKERSVDEIKAALLEQENRLAEKEKALDEKLREAEQGLKEIEESKANLEEAIEAKKASLLQYQTDHIKLLGSILEQYAGTVKEQAKRRPDMLMRETQIQRINKLLEELRDYFSGSESADYLHLAEEPRREDLEHYPGTTYGEMDVLLAAYKCTVQAFLYGELYEKLPEPEAE